MPTGTATRICSANSGTGSANSRMEGSGPAATPNARRARHSTPDAPLDVFSFAPHEAADMTERRWHPVQRMISERHGAGPADDPRQAEGPPAEGPRQGTERPHQGAEGPRQADGPPLGADGRRQWGTGPGAGSGAAEPAG